MDEQRTPAPGVNAIDFYRSEIDRLRADLAAHKLDCDGCLDERMLLRAEVHEANAACDAQIRECNHLRAAMELAERCHLEQAMQWKIEIDRLRAENATQDKLILEWGDRYADLSNETDRLRAENAELRARIASDLPASGQERQKSS